MKVVIKIIAVIFFVIFFILFLAATTLKFEILNKFFVFSSFERNNIYSKLVKNLPNSVLNDPNLSVQERVAYNNMISNVNPLAVKSLVERNLSGIFDYINGGSKDITIYSSSKDLGVTGADINWSINRNMPQSDAKFVQMFNGVGQSIFYLWIALIFFLLLFFIKAGRIGILISGVLAILLGSLGRIFLSVIIFNTPFIEPAQILLVLLSGSLLSDIAISWIIIGVVFVGLWLILRLKNKFS